MSAETVAMLIYGGVCTIVGFYFGFMEGKRRESDWWHAFYERSK